MLAATSTCLSAALLLIAPAEDRETYEWSRTAGLLQDQDLVLEPEPEGKRIVWIRVVRDEVFVGKEVWPLWLNFLHARTRERVVQREFLLDEGDLYADARIEESMRILRSMGIFALVRIVAVRGEEPGTVGIIVHTRDLWSLRLETAFNVSTQINALNLNLVERNLAGLNHALGVGFGMVPDTITLSESYATRRTFGLPIGISQNGGIIFNRDHGRPEGGFAGARVGRRFYDLSQQTAYSLSASHSSRIVRQLANGEAQAWVPEGLDEAAGLRVWEQQTSRLRASVAFRRGEKSKNTWTLGFFFTDRNVSPNAESNIDAQLQDAFAEEVMPPARRQVGPSFAYDVFVPRFKTYTNLDTYGQSENVRLGPSARVSASAPRASLGSTENAWIGSADVGWSFAPLGGLLRLSMSTSARWENARATDETVGALIRAASPMFGPVRLVSRVGLGMRWHDTSNAQVSLGSANGLRGYPSQFMTGFGVNRFRANFELRTKPVEWRAIHVGGVIFYDMGSVFDSFRTLELAQGFGFGLRLLFPQFNRDPFTADLGFSSDPSRVVPTITSSQVAPMN